MSYPPDPNNPYAKPQQPPQQPGYGYPQQPPAQPQYGYPQQGAPQGPPQGYQDPYAQQPPQQPGYGYPQQAPAGYQTSPYGMAGYGQGQYASWGKRAGATLIDFLYFGLVPTVLLFIGLGIVLASTKTTVDAYGYPHVSTGGGAAIGALLYGLAALLSLVGGIWLIYKEGTTGQTPGKAKMGIRLVREADGQVLGFGMAFVRRIAHALDGAVCYLGFLWPLWDDKKQTFADKVMSSVVVQGQ